MASFLSARSKCVLNVLFLLVGIASTNLSHATSYNYSTSSSSPILQGYAETQTGCDTIYTFTMNTGAESMGQGATYTFGMTESGSGTYYANGWPVPCPGTYTVTITDLAIWCNSTQWQNTSFNMTTSAGNLSSNGGGYAVINGGGSDGNCQDNGWHYAYTNGQANKGNVGDGGTSNPGHVLVFTASSVAAGTAIYPTLYGNDTNGSQNIYYIISSTKDTGTAGTITIQRTGP